MMELFFFVLGAFLGSFLNVCIIRIPQQISIVYPPSRCPICNERLKPWDLIPIISFIIFRGRCHYCKAPISFQYPFVEVLTGMIFLLTYLKVGLTWQTWHYLLLFSVLVVVSGIDARERVIPDEITLPGIVIGLILTPFIGHIPFFSALLGAIVGGGIFLAIAVLTRGGMGGGDIKLLAFIGAFIGVKSVLLTIFIGSLLGSLYGIYLMIFKKVGRKAAIPYGPFLSLGAFIITLYGNDLINIYVHLFLR